MPSDQKAAIARVREVLDAYSRKDFDAVLELNDPDVELIRAGGLGTLRGIDALRAWMEPDAFESQVIEPLEFRASGDKVLIHQRSKIRGAGSGADTEFLSWGVWTLDEELRVTRVQIFLDHEQAAALEAAGLEDER